MRPAKKSRERGLFKRCSHLWDRCDCPWLGRFKKQRWINLANWAGLGKRSLTRTEAIDVLAEARGQVLRGEFDPRGKTVNLDAASMTFEQFIGRYIEDYVEKKRADGKLRSSSLDHYLGVFKRAFGSEPLARLACEPGSWQKWLDSLQVNKGKKTERKLSPAASNRYYEHGRKLFNWAISQGLVKSNPFLKFSKRPERNTRQTRIVPEQEKALFEALPKLHRKRQRTEMERRLIAAIDLGLREGEMLKVRVKHVDFKTWRITLPPENTKGGATTDRAEVVYAMTPRIQKALEERRFLGPDKYVFGSESGAYVASFDKSWRELFKLAGLPVGRKNGLVWHDLRHEFISYLVDKGGEIHEVKEAARHRDIRTTERYMKAREERLKALMGKMADRQHA